MAQQPKYLRELWQSDVIKNWGGASAAASGLQTQHRNGAPVSPKAQHTVFAAATAVKVPPLPERGALYIGGRNRDDDGADDERISDANKIKQIADLVRPLVPDVLRGKKFGRWLIDMHGGAEHDHFRWLSPELEEAVRQWQDESPRSIPQEEHDARARRAGERQPKKTAAGRGAPGQPTRAENSSKGNGTGGGNTTGSGATTPSTPPSGVSGGGTETPGGADGGTPHSKPSGTTTPSDHTSPSKRPTDKDGNDRESPDGRSSRHERDDNHDQKRKKKPPRRRRK